MKEKVAEFKRGKCIDDIVVQQIWLEGKVGQKTWYLNGNGSQPMWLDE